MECLLQYWDHLDDLLGALALFGERIRRLVLFTLYATLLIILQVGVVLLAIVQPPLAMAAATILLVALMYHLTTNPPLRPAAAL